MSYLKYTSYEVFPADGDICSRKKTEDEEAGYGQINFKSNEKLLLLDDSVFALSI